jgi:hypothetical protein
MAPMNQMRKERLELSRVTPLEPKSSASTSSATLASLWIKGAIFTGVFVDNQADFLTI